MITKKTEITKENKQELSFFLNKKGEIKFCDKCEKCEKACKQSYRAQIIKCPNYVKKVEVSNESEQR